MDVGIGVDSTFAHQHAAIFDQLGHAQRVAEIGLEVPQVSVVDSEQAVALVREADDPVAHPDEILQIVNFNQHGHVHFGRQDLQIDQPAHLQALGDQ